MQNGFLKRPYKEMKKEEKQSTKDKRENIPIRMQNPKNSKERYESLVKWAMQKTTQNKTKQKTEESNTMGKTRDVFKKIRESKGTFHVMMGT